MTLADAQQALSTGPAQAILAAVVLALVAALFAVVRHHLNESALAQARERELQEKRLELAMRVLRAQERLAGIEDQEGRP